MTFCLTSDHEVPIVVQRMMKKTACFVYCSLYEKQCMIQDHFTSNRLYKIKESPITFQLNISLSIHSETTDPCPSCSPLRSSLLFEWLQVNGVFIAFCTPCLHSDDYQVGLTVATFKSVLDAVLPDSINILACDVYHFDRCITRIHDLHRDRRSRSKTHKALIETVTSS